jgi:hypothetical protein
MKNAIVFLTVRPNMQLIRFAEKFNGSIITPYICIDDSNYNVSSMTVNTIKYSYSECMSRGFKNLILPSTLKNQKRPCAWDKAFYHFCIKDTSYDNVYFIEDDVFIPFPITIFNIDKKYPFADLLCESHTIRKYNDNWPHWNSITKYFDVPLYHSMVCACRVSKRMLYIVSCFAKINKTLLYHECFLNTLAAKYNLRIKTPDEFKSVTWNNKWELKDIKINQLYHPVKDYNSHKIFRNFLLLNNRTENNANKEMNTNKENNKLKILN